MQNMPDDDIKVPDKYKDSPTLSKDYKRGYKTGQTTVKVVKATATVTGLVGAGDKLIDGGGSGNN